MTRVECFGEIMLRLNPEGYKRFVQADRLEATYAGSEASVAVSLANFGIPASFVTKLPNNEIGQAAINSLRKYGVNTSAIVRGGERVGVYFTEKGAAQRPSKVIYDRKYSAISMALPAEFNWGQILEGASWFHFSGITPALSDSMAQACLDACRVAKSKNITVSCDLNYRGKLWSSEQACKVLTPMMEYVDVCIGNEEDADKIFGIRASNTSSTNYKSLNTEAYHEVASKMMDTFGFKQVALSLRESISANDNVWSGLLFDGDNSYRSQQYNMHVVDRLGGGDSFCAGLIYSMCQGYTAQKAIEFAVAASCLKHSIEFDFNLTNVSEVESLLSGNSTGRVQR